MVSTVIKFTKSLNAWRRPEFEAVFKQEVRDLDKTILPLQAALSQSSHVSESAIDPVVLINSETEDHIRIKTGIFYSGIIAGSCCADDPTPLCEQAEYCELQFEIDKRTAQVSIDLLQADGEG
jgi:hypothetical protein